jgi:hypothetical protein
LRWKKEEGSKNRKAQGVRREGGRAFTKLLPTELRWRIEDGSKGTEPFGKMTEERKSVLVMGDRRPLL